MHKYAVKTVAKPFVNFLIGINIVSYYLLCQTMKIDSNLIHFALLGFTSMNSTRFEFFWEMPLFFRLNAVNAAIFPVQRR